MGDIFGRLPHLGIPWIPELAIQGEGHFLFGGLPEAPLLYHKEPNPPSRAKSDQTVSEAVNILGGVAGRDAYRFQGRWLVKSIDFKKRRICMKWSLDQLDVIKCLGE